MNKRIRSMIDTIFCEMKMTAENLALRDELMANAQARFDDAISQGKTEEEAFAEVAVSLEDVSDLLRDMNADHPQTDAEDTASSCFVDSQSETASQPQDEVPQTDLGDALNKAFSALGSWGQSIMPRAKKFARQMDDATGGMLSDIGRAVNKGMQDAQKAASDVLDKYQQPTADAVFTTEKTPEDLREEAKDLRAQADLKRVTGDAPGAQDLYAQAEALETQADALDQAQAIADAQKAAEADVQHASEDSPFIIYAEPAADEPAQAEPIYGADGELNEDAFARSVEQMTKDAEKLVRDAGSVIGSAAKQAGDIISDAVNGKRDPQAREIRFPAAGLRRIDAKLDADDITLEATDGDEVIVFWSAQSAENEPEVSLHHHTLTIRRKNPDVFKTFFSVFSKNGGQITVLIPRGYAADYALSTTSGDIRLSGMDADDIAISTTSGHVRVEPDVRVRAKNIRVETISGSITVSATAIDISAETISGEVFISCDAASVKGDVVSGKLHIEGASDNWDVDAVSGSTELICTTVPTGKIKIDTISGGATLYLPGSIRGFTVEFDSISGSLKNEFGPDRYGTCALPIHMDTISGKMTIARL